MEQIIKTLGTVRPTPEGEHNSNKEYKKLAIVYSVSDNKSYIAKQDVPKGVYINNKTYWQVFGNGKFVDNGFINVSYLEDSIIAHTLAEAISMIAKEDRKPGVVITFFESDTEVNHPAGWNLYQFKGNSADDWDKQIYWHNVYQNNSPFKGWFYNGTDLVQKYPNPFKGYYAYVGDTLNVAKVWRCNNDSIWSKTEENVKKQIELVFGGNITISENDTWIINGIDTGLEAKGNPGITPLLRTNEDLEIIQVSYDNGETYQTLINYNDLKANIQAQAVTGAAGTQASVENIGTSVNPIFKFIIPKGDKGDKGDKGNSGYSGAAEDLEIVNDLDADDPEEDATKGLSAYQGYVLDGKISQLGQDINSANANLSVKITDLNLKDYNIRSDGTFGSTPDNKHACLSVRAGEIYYIKTNYSNYNAAFATSDSAEAGGIIPLVSGTDIIPIGQNAYCKIVVPTDCYLLFSAGSGNYTDCYIYDITAFLEANNENTPTYKGTRAVKSGGIYDGLISLAKDVSLICEDVNVGITTGYYKVTNNIITNDTSPSRSRFYKIPVIEGESYVIFTNIYGHSVDAFLFGNSNNELISKSEVDVTVSTPKCYYVRVPQGAAFLYVNNYNTDGSTPFVRKAISIFQETNERERTDNILANAIGKYLVPQGTDMGQGTYDGAIGSVVSFTPSSAWTASIMSVADSKVVRVKTTIYGSTHYGIVFVDANNVVISNLYLRGTSVNQDIDATIIVPEGATKVYVNKRGGTFYPTIYGLANSGDVLCGNTIKVLTTNCGSFNYGDDETSLATYQQNWRKMLNESEFDIWGVEDWAQFFDYGVEMIDSQDAIVANTIQGTFPSVKSGNDRTRVFYRGICKLEEDADNASSIHHVSKNINGKIVHFFIVYFVSGSADDKVAARYQTALRIINAISSSGIEYAVIMGDFNAWSASEYDVWKNAGYKVANCDYLGEIDTLRDIPADNIIVTPRLNIIKTEIIDMFPLNTDHKPMKGILEII